MMEIVDYLSINKPYDAWECQSCGTVTPITKGLPVPECEYCQRVKQKEFIKKGLKLLKEKRIKEKQCSKTL